MQYTIPLFPEHKISIRLFADVHDAASILAGIKSTEDPSYRLCFLDARLCMSIDQIVYAALRAIRDEQDGQLRTKTVHSGIVYSLSPNQNITEAFKNFGIAEDSTSVICVAINDILEPHLVNGTEEDVTDERLMHYCDLPSVKKMYKIDDKVTDLEEIKAQVITSIALKGNL